MKSTFELKIFFGLINQRYALEEKKLALNQKSEIFSGLINHRCNSWGERNLKFYIKNIFWPDSSHMCTWWEEINLKMRNIFLACLITVVHLEKWIIFITKNIFQAWLISYVHFGKRNQLWNEKYFSGLINLRCTLGERKSTEKKLT